MSKKRKAGAAILLIIAAFAAAVLYIGRADMGQASEVQAVEAPPVTGLKSPVLYEVQKGDCLWSVAKKFNIDLKLLAYVNDIGEEDLLYENSEIIIPDGNRIVYTVAPGDTLWSLAERFDTTIEALVSENGDNILQTLAADRDIAIPAGPETFDEMKLAPEKPEQTDSNNEDSTALSRINIPKLSSWPVEGRVSSVFGSRWGRMHKGIDIAAETGEPIRAVEDGVVAFSGDRGTYGNTVIINHGNGFRSQYAHASKLLVSVGERVEKGQVIARVGNTGRSTGPHLHLELLYNGQPVDPEKYLPSKL